MNDLVEKVINGKTYLVDKNGKICYTKDEPKTDDSEMNEFTLTLNIKTNGKKVDCWLSDDIGGSGISIKENTKGKFFKALTNYINEYITNN